MQDINFLHKYENRGIPLEVPNKLKIHTKLNTLTLEDCYFC